MCRHYRVRTITLVLLVAILGVSAHPANAGRVGAAPLLSQFEMGYGVVAAQVVDAKRVTAEDEYPAIYDCSFKVYDVAAQPLTGEVFPLHSGDPLKIQLSAGYACQIEYDVESALAKGKRYYLIIRKGDDGKFEHAEGASALRAVEEFQDAENQYYVRVRGLAAEPEKARLMAWVKVVKNPTESERLRSDALSGIFMRLWPGTHAAGGMDARSSLRKVWSDPQSNLSFALTVQLDYVLRVTDRGFEDSADRRDVWLKILLTLTPERKRDDNSVDNMAFSVLNDLAKKHPSATGEQLAAKLLNKEWPALYRRAIASGLLTAYRFADRVDPKWELIIQSYFIDLMKTGEPFPIRVAAGDLEYFAGIKSPGDSAVKRSFVPDPKVKAALSTAVDRLTAASRQPGANQEFKVAALELARVVQALDAPRNP